MTAERTAERRADAPLNILVIEDDPKVSILLTAMLEARGHSVTSFASGEDALTAVEGGLVPEMVISDHGLSGELKGPEVLRRIKEKHNIYGTILTGDIGKITQEERSYIDNAFQKPINFAMVDAQVNQARKHLSKSSS